MSNSVPTLESPSLKVTTLADVVDPTDNQTSLREALAFANSNADASTITFDASLKGQTLFLRQGELSIITDVVIEGDIDSDGGADITISADSTLGADDATSRVLTIDNSSISSTIAATLDGLVIRDGNSSTAGGIYVGILDTLALSNSIVTGNTSAGIAGGISGRSGSVITVINSTIADNSSSDNGGGIAASGRALMLINSTVSGNRATDSFGNGGGIYGGSGTAITLVNSTIADNAAGRRGGGVYGWAGNAITVINSTITGNSAGTAHPWGDGGGIYNYGSTAVTKLVNSILAGNHASRFGNDLYGGRPTAPGNQSDLVFEGNNIIGSAPQNFTPVTGQDSHAMLIDGASQAALEQVFKSVGMVDPDGAGGKPAFLAGLLADNGGPVETVAIRLGGSAQDTGVAAAAVYDHDRNPATAPLPIAHDARGADRVSGVRVDLGAVELQVTLAPEQTPVAVDPAFAVTHADGTPTSSRVSIVSGLRPGEDVLALPDGVAFGDITASYDAATGTLTLTSAGAAAAPGDWDAALRAVTYTNTSDTPDTATRTLSFVTNDGSDNSTTSVRSLTVVPVNDAPSATSLGIPSSFIEDGSPVALAPAIVLRDPDSPMLVFAKVAIVANFHPGEDVLDFTAPAGISGNYNAATGELLLVGVAATADYQAVLRSVTFRNSSDAPNLATRSITFTVSDGQAIREVAVNTIDVHPRNDDPYLADGIADVTSPEDAVWTFTVPAGAFGDADGDPLAYSAKLQSGAPLPAWLTFDPVTGTFSGQPPQDFSGKLRLWVSATDQSGSAEASFTLTVTPVNDAPTLQGITASAYTTGGPAKVLAPALTVGDVDNPFLAGAAVRISDPATGDRLAIDLPMTGSFVGGTEIAARYKSATGTLYLTGTDTLAHYQDVLRHVTYASSSPGATDSTRTIEWWVDDGSQQELRFEDAARVPVPVGLVTAADLTSDGRPDLVWIDFSGHALNVAIAAGDGSFAAPLTQQFGSRQYPSQVVSADFNRDGYLDLATPLYIDRVVAVMLGDGSGHFAAPTFIDVGVDPTGLVAGDFNGDGAPDLAAAVYHEDHVAIALGDGRGGFGPVTTVRTEEGPYALETGDVDGDGKLDLVVVNNMSQKLSIYRGTGDGSFEIVSVLEGFSYPNLIRIGDVNEDGALDLLVSDLSSVKLFLGSGNGQFGLPQLVLDHPDGAFELGDLDRDGHLDLVVPISGSGSASLMILRGTGDGSFLRVADLPLEARAPSVVLADFNRDGFLDIADGMGDVFLADFSDRGAVQRSTLSIEVASSGPLNAAPVNAMPSVLEVEANTATAIAGLSVADDLISGILTTTLAVAHGTLTLASAGGAAITGNGTATVVLGGTQVQINAALAAPNITYRAAPDFFGTDTLTMATNDNGDAGTGGPLTDTDQVGIHVNTLLTGTPADDVFAAGPGNMRIDAFGGIDTVTFEFRLVDATVTYSGNAVTIDSASSHTVLSGFERFGFSDGVVENNDGDPLVDDLFYYSHNHDVWNAHADADRDYASAGWSEGRDPNAFFDTDLYQAIYHPSGNPLVDFHTSGWMRGNVPSLAFDGEKYLRANPDVAAAGVDPLAHFLATGAQEGRQPFAVTQLLTGDGFDYAYYLLHNPDVAAAGIDPLQHFGTIGWTEGRDPNALFDTSGYLATYTDVAAAHVNPFDHYNGWGWREGRDPSVGFDTVAYLAANPDVAAAQVNPLSHYLHAGQYENRSAAGDGVWG